MKPVVYSGVLIVSVLAVMLCAAPVEAQEPVRRGVCVERDSDGRGVWKSHDPEIERHARDVQGELIASNPGGVNLVAICSDSRRIKVVTSATAAAARLRSDDLYARVDLDHKTLESLKEQLGKNYKADRVSFDIETAGLHVYGQWEQAPQVRSIAGVPISFHARKGRSAPAGTRLSDVAPWFMGTAYNYDRGDKTYRCSLGSPVTIGSKRYMLSAGHCKADNHTYRHNGRFIGQEYMSSYGHPNGDWLLMTVPDKASLRLYSGPLNSSNSLPIGGGAYNPLPQGHQLCSSGSTTGSICRYVVESTWDHVWYLADGWPLLVGLSNITTLSHQGDGDAGWRRGDSGGSVYYNNGANSMIIAGIVSGSFENYFGADSYYMQQWTGIHAWNRNVRVGN